MKKTKKTKKTILTILLLLLIATPFFAKELTDEQKQAIFMMNYSQYVTYKLKTYNNILMLEDSYKTLKDNMNLGKIKDSQSVAQINQLLDAMNEEIKQNKKLDYLKKKFERKMEKALYNSIPNVSALLYGGFDPATLAINTALAIGRSYVNYENFKNELNEELEDNMFEYEESFMNILNNRYTSLNDYSYSLLSIYSIPDNCRLNEIELEKMFKCIKAENPKTRYDNLELLSKNEYIQYFPVFWYHLAIAAYDIGKYDAALEYLSIYEKKNIDMFRYNYDSIDAYKLKITILLKKIQDSKVSLLANFNLRNEIKTKTDYIRKNSDRWTDLYYCALVCNYLDYNDSAIEILEDNIKILTLEVEQTVSENYLANFFKEYEEEKKINKKSSELLNVGLSAYSALELNKQLLLNINKEKVTLENIEKQNKLGIFNSFEKLWYFGKKSKYDQIQSSLKSFKEINLTIDMYSEKFGNIKVELPYNMVLSSDSKLEVVLSNNKDAEITKKVPLSVDVKKTKKSDSSTVYYGMTFDVINEKEITGIKGKAIDILDDAKMILFFGVADLLNTEEYSFKGLQLSNSIYSVFIEFNSYNNKKKKGKKLTPSKIYCNGEEYEL